MAGESKAAVAAAVYEVIDPRDGNRVVGKYKSASRARSKRDALDNKYGAYRYRVRKVVA